jgi:hypothetical protein
MSSIIYFSIQEISLARPCEKSGLRNEKGVRPGPRQESVSDQSRRMKKHAARAAKQTEQFAWKIRTAFATCDAHLQ